MCRRMLRLSYVASLSVLMLEAAALEGRADPISPFNPHPQTTYTGAISQIIYTGASCTENQLTVTFESLKVSRKKW